MTEETTNFFNLIGGDSGVRELVMEFYRVMETDPVAAQCLHVHHLQDGAVPMPVKEKLVDFLTGWFGGPPVFVEKYGHPRMRARHLHVPIAVTHAEQWLYCMHRSLQVHSSKLPDQHKNELMNAFMGLAGRIVNA